MLDEFDVEFDIIGEFHGAEKEANSNPVLCYMCLFCVVVNLYMWIQIIFQWPFIVLFSKET